MRVKFGTSCIVEDVYLGKTILQPPDSLIFNILNLLQTSTFTKAAKGGTSDCPTVDCHSRGRQTHCYARMSQRFEPPHTTPATKKEHVNVVRQFSRASAPRNMTSFLTSYTYYCTAVSCKNLCLHRALFRYSQGHNKHDILDYKILGSDNIINLNHKTKKILYSTFQARKCTLWSGKYGIRPCHEKM
jgi:hypothetical protein